MSTNGGEEGRRLCLLCLRNSPQRDVCDPDFTSNPWKHCVQSISATPVFRTIVAQFDVSSTDGRGMIVTRTDRCVDRARVATSTQRLNVGGGVQGEVFAAEGWGKATGEVGVCIATSGPGATNLVTGLADALLDSVPMVAITGQVRLLTRRLPVQRCLLFGGVVRQGPCRRGGARARSSHDRSRLRARAVQVPRPMIGTDAFQETPIVEITRQITKHNYLVLDIADLPRIMKVCF